jgi:hypothetical protein
MDIGKLVLSPEAIDIVKTGAWVKDLAGAPGVSLCVTGFSRNTEAQRALHKKLEHIQENENRNEEPTSDQRDMAIREVLADLVLKDWKGFTNEGKALKYSAKQAREWITSEGGDALAGLVLTAAKKIDDNAQSFVEGVTKN